LRLSARPFLFRPIKSWVFFSFSNPPRRIEEEIESQERGLESLRLELGRQRESIDRNVAFLVSRVDELGREFGKVRSEVEAVRDSAGGEIGKLKSETAKVAKSVSGLETLRREFDDLKVSVERLQQAFTRVGRPSTNPGILHRKETKQPAQNQFLLFNHNRRQPSPHMAR
jgi:hypothetical protein